MSEEQPKDFAEQLIAARREGYTEGLHANLQEAATRLFVGALKSNTVQVGMTVTDPKK